MHGSQVQCLCYFGGRGFKTTWLPGNVAMWPVVYDEFNNPYTPIRFNR